MPAPAPQPAPAPAAAPTPLPAPEPATAAAPAEKAAAAAKSDSASDVPAGGGAASSGVSVSLVRQPTRENTGFVAVSVPKGTSTEGIGFSVPLPTEVANAVNAGPAVPNAMPASAAPGSNAVSQANRAIEVRAVVNGRSLPLPSWLRYLPEQQTFVATAVPDGGLPITIEIIVAGQRTLMVISERPT